MNAGDVLEDRFELRAELGRGGHGVVWRAFDRFDGVEVAVKILDVRSDRKLAKRFLQEARILAELVHPNIARAITTGEAGGNPFFAMELVAGKTIEKAALDDLLIRRVARELASALDCAHERLIVHRDLKPTNVMLGSTGTVKVLDFGIAKVLDSGLDLTTQGRMMGTVFYISPEQILGKSTDGRADLFALGTIVFELVTRRKAWARDTNDQPLSVDDEYGPELANSRVEVLKRISRGPRPSARDVRALLPTAVDRVLMKAMAIDADARYPSAGAFAHAFDAAWDEEDRAPPSEAVTEPLTTPNSKPRS